MIYFDVGANIGFFAMIAARLIGPVGQVVCFEPVDCNARQIQHNAALNRFENVRTITCALANHNGAAKFATSSEPTLGALTNGEILPREFESTIDVSCYRLDDLGLT